MKKIVVVLLCLALTLSVSCFAIEEDAYWFPNGDGTYGYDWDGYNHDLAVEMISAAGLDINADNYWVYDGEYYHFDNDAFLADYNAFVNVPEPDPAPIETPVPDDEPVPDPYPVPWPDEPAEDDITIEPLEDETSFEVLQDHLELELGENQPLSYSVNDLRSDGDIEIDLGLKSVIRTIFGEYSPNMTTVTVTETIDGEVVTTLIDAVADGSAGVDWEYISGVFLFGIMLFCLFKFLGGIFS